MINRQTTLLYCSLLVVVALLGGYVYYTQVIKGTEIVAPPLPVSQQDDLKSFQNLNIDLTVLDNPIYRSLNTFGEVPVSPGVTGKKDIFAP